MYKNYKMKIKKTECVMGALKDDSGIVGFFKKAVTLLTEGIIPSYGPVEVKAALFQHSRASATPARKHACEEFLASLQINKKMDFNEVFDILEKLEIHMNDKFGNPDASRHLLSDRADKDMQFIASYISHMSNEDMKLAAHEFDQLRTTKSKPHLVIDNTHG